MEATSPRAPLSPVPDNDSQRIPGHQLDKQAVMASVNGTRGDGTSIAFTLTALEIKHIRRALYLYERIHPPVMDHASMGGDLIARFRRFGKITRFKSEARRRLRKRLPNYCAVCGATQRLTIDHLIPRAQGGTSRRENVQTLCASCHHQKNLKERIQRKHQELHHLEAQLLALQAPQHDARPQ